MVSGSPDGQVCVWDLATGKERHRFRVPGDDPEELPQLAQRGFVLSPDRKLVAARHRRGPVLRWEVATGTYVMRLVPDPRNSAAELFALTRNAAPPVFSPDGRLVAVGGATTAAGARGVGFTIQLWEPASRAVRAKFAGHAGAVTALAFSADGRRLASSSADTTILIWDLSSRASSPAVETKLTAKQLDDLWDELKTPDAAKAFQAMQTLLAAPRDAVPYLARALLPDPGKTMDAAAGSLPTWTTTTLPSARRPAGPWRRWGGRR